MRETWKNLKFAWQYTKEYKKELKKYIFASIIYMIISIIVPILSARTILALTKSMFTQCH